MKKRVVITGATGFVGRFALNRLQEAGYEVHGVTHAERSSHPSGVVWHERDLLDPVQSYELMEQIRPTHLLHFAWYTKHGLFWSASVNMDWVTASIKLLQAFNDFGGNRAVFVGSCAEYAEVDTACVEGETRLEPRTLYGACKHALHSMSAVYAGQSGFSFAWGRIFHLYGPGEVKERLVPSVIDALLSRMPVQCTHGRQLRDFMYVEDVAGACVKLLDSPIQGAVNIATGDVVSIGTVVEKIARLIGRSDLVQMGALPTSNDDPACLIADTSRLQNEVGWCCNYSLEAGLTKTIALHNKMRKSTDEEY